MKSIRLMEMADLRDTLSSRPFVHVVVISSEDRSIASVEALCHLDCIPSRLLAFTYPRFQEIRAERRGPTNHDRLVTMMKPAKPLVKEVSNAHAFSMLHRELANIIDRAQRLPIVIDFTCMTEVHLLALVSVAMTATRLESELYFCYTTPQYYSFEEQGFIGWKDVLFVPIGDLTAASSDGHSQGLILPGHDGERLAVALQEYEPESGMILYTRPEGRPDFLLKAREANRTVAQRLLLLRSGPQSNAAETAWCEAGTMLDDLDQVLEISTALAEKARRTAGPLMLFPFGPKLVTLAAALAMTEERGLASWAVCPIPTRHRPDFTFGSGHTYCLALHL